jgi:Icc-related predicted phosphoesterase
MKGISFFFLKIHNVKIVCISDTHGYLPDSLPYGDVLVHAGDATARGTEKEHWDFVRWMNRQPHPTKLFVAGNHCLFLESCYKYYFENVMEENIGESIYLRDSSVSVEGKSFWGTPWTPEFFDWAFMYKTPNEGHEHFSKIPVGTDVLICHGPPYGILDLCPDHSKKNSFKHAGSKELLFHIKRVKPKLVIMGHIHHSYGQEMRDGILYVNASHCTEAYEPLNEPIVVEI